MPTLGFNQTNFNSGVLSSQLYGRIDLARYKNGAKKILNFICLPHGPLTRRMGTKFIWEAKNADKTARLVPFEFSTEQAYMLEFGDTYVRAYKDGEIIAHDTLMTAATKANPCVITIGAGHRYVNGQSITITNVVGMTELNGNTYTVSNVAGTTAELNVDSTAFGVYTSGGNVTGIFEIDTTYLEAELASLDTAQSADTLYIGQQQHKQATLTRSDHDNWTLADITFTAAPTEWDTTYKYPGNVTFMNDRLFWGGSPGYPQRIWASQVGIYNDHTVNVTPVDSDAITLTLGGKKVNAIQWLISSRRLALGTTGNEYWITDATGDGPITHLSKQAIPGSEYGCADVRPVMAGSTLIYVQRQGRILREFLYDSVSEAFVGEELTLLVEHLTRDYGITKLAFQRTPYKVIWAIREDGKLLGLTYHKEHEVWGWHVHETEGFFEDVEILPGAAEDEVWLIVRRVINGSTVRFVERMQESFTAEDTTNGFYVDSGLTLDNRQTVESISFANPGVVTLTAHGYSNGDSVRFRTVDDTIAGEESYLSLNNEQFTIAHSTADTFQLHDDLLADVDFTVYKQVVSATVAKNVTSISGLDHLEAEEVTVCADGAEATNSPFTVSSGAITLTEPASVVHIGLNFISDFESFHPTFPEEKIGPGNVKRITDIIVRLFNSLGMQYGPDFDNLRHYEFTGLDTPDGIAASSFNGFTKAVSLSSGGTSREPTICLRQDQPLPLTILSIYADVDVAMEE